MSRTEKIPTDGGKGLGHSPFDNLSRAGLPSGPVSTPAKPAEASGPAASSATAQKNRGRVEIRRQTAGRGGKTVTVVSGFVGIGLPEKEQLAKRMQKTCGCGGTVKDGCIEVQGDKREQVALILRDAGFRPVFAGG